MYTWYIIIQIIILCALAYTHMCYERCKPWEMNRPHTYRGVWMKDTLVCNNSLSSIASKKMWQSVKLPLASRNILLLWWGPKSVHMLQSLNMVYFHFTQSLRAHEKLQGWDFVSQAMALGWFPRPLDFHGHGSWSLCKAVLNLPIGKWRCSEETYRIKFYF